MNEAERLAKELDEDFHLSYPSESMWKAAEELRRLSAIEQQRTWVGLTDEDVVSLCREFMGQFDKREFIKATEAKLKEKNT